MAGSDCQRRAEGHGKPKALRRHWYCRYTSGFAQPLAMALSDYQVNASRVSGLVFYSAAQWTIEFEL